MRQLPTPPERLNSAVAVFARKRLPVFRQVAAPSTAPKPRRGAGGADDALDRLIDSAHRAAIERRIAIARIAAAVTLLIVMGVGSDAFHSDRVTILMGAYAVYAAFVLAMHVRYPLTTTTTAVACALHVVDLIWATLSTAQSGGASSHTFLLFLLVLMVAAYRWSLAGSLVTGLAVLLITSLEAVAATRGYFDWPFELDTFLALTSAVVVFAVIFGLLSEKLHALGAQAITLGEVLRGVSRARGMTAAIHETLAQILMLFRSRGVVVAVEEDDGAASLWEARAGQVLPLLSRRELSRDERASLFFALPSYGRTSELRRMARGDAATMHTLGTDGVLHRHVVDRVPPLPGIEGCRTVVFTASEVPRCWTIRLFVLDPERPSDLVLRLALLQKLVDQVTPSLASLYLLRRLRSRAEARERARIARELHDGVVQTLAVLDLRLEMARRRVGAIDAALADDLSQTRLLLRADVANLRELIDRMRPLEVDGARLPAELADVVERFSRLADIEARLVWAADGVELSPRQCEEVIRIVQEALVNVRRHSHATEVVVRVSADIAEWEVIVADNGRGFGFAGVRSHAELKQGGEGPRVIRERVEALGGSLVIQSSSSGARLSMVFPRVRSVSEVL